MKNPAFTIAVFGVYLAATGLSFILAPNTVLPLFGFPATTEVWIRVVGLLSLVLGVYFLYAVRYNDRRFFEATVIARGLFCGGLVVFALLGLGSPILILFGLIDLAGAVWTGLTLRSVP